jgi:hypothetical protein
VSGATADPSGVIGLGESTGLGAHLDRGRGGSVGTQPVPTAVVGGRSPLVLVWAVVSAGALVVIVRTAVVSQSFGCTPVGPAGWAMAHRLGRRHGDVTGRSLSSRPDPGSPTAEGLTDHPPRTPLVSPPHGWGSNPTLVRRRHIPASGAGHGHWDGNTDDGVRGDQERTGAAWGHRSPGQVGGDRRLAVAPPPEGSDTVRRGRVR